MYALQPCSNEKQRTSIVALPASGGTGIYQPKRQWGPLIAVVLNLGSSPALLTVNLLQT